MNQSTSFAQVATNLLNVLQGYTKGIRFLLVMFLTLTVSANVWGETMTTTFTDADKFEVDGWTQTSATAIQGFANNGVQVTWNSIKNNPLQLKNTTDFAGYTITNIVLNYYSNGNSGTGNITIGGNSFGSSKTLSGGSSGSYNTAVFEGESKGDIVITISSTSTSKSIYIKSITVTYETSNSGGGDSGDTNCLTLSATSNYPFNSTSSTNTSVSSTIIDGITFENEGGYKYSSYLSFNRSLLGAYIANTTPFSGNIESIVVDYNSGGSSYFDMYEGSASKPSSTVVSPSKIGTGSVTYTFSGNNPYFKLALKTTGDYCNINSITICYSNTAAPSHTVTATSNNNNYGTVSVSGTTITASPKTGYTYANPAYTVTSGSATVSQDGNTFSVTPSSDCTITINFEAIPQNTVKWYIKDDVTTTPLSNGTTTMPADPTGDDALCGTKTFVGWSDVEVTDGNKPTILFKQEDGIPNTINLTNGTTFYAVYADTHTTTTITYTWDLLKQSTNPKLAVGDQIVIAAKDDDYALSTTQNTDTRGAVAVTKNSNSITINNNVQIFTIENGNEENTFALATGNGYLSGTRRKAGRNYYEQLNTATSKASANASWYIGFTEETTPYIYNEVSEKSGRNYEYPNYYVGFNYEYDWWESEYTYYFEAVRDASTWYDYNPKNISIYRKTQQTTTTTVNSGYTTDCGCSEPANPLAFSNQTITADEKLTLAPNTGTGNGGAITYTCSDATHTTIDGYQFSATALNTYTITATQGVNDNKCGAIVDFEVTVKCATPRITPTTYETTINTPVDLKSVIESSSTMPLTFACTDENVYISGTNFTFLAAGSYTITASQEAGGIFCEDSQNITITVTDPCAGKKTPTVTAGAITTDGFTLSWSTIAGVSTYRIYNNTTGDSDETTSTSYTFSGLNPSTEYSWTVEAVYSDDGCTAAASGTTTTSKPVVTYTVNWNVAGEPYTTYGGSTSVIHGEQVSALPTTAPDPSDYSCGDKAFVGWSKSQYLDGTRPADLFTTAAGSPVITAATTFYAVFADCVTDGGDDTPEDDTQGEWTLVTDVNDLQAGDKIIIACYSKEKAASELTSAILSVDADVTFSNSGNTLTPSASTLIFTLGGSTGAWTFANSSDQLLGATAVKKLAWDGGTTTWRISISGNNATIQNGTDSYGRFLYNVGSPRFTTYTSSTSESMLLPQIYKKTGSGSGGGETPEPEEYTVTLSVLGETSEENTTSNYTLPIDVDAACVGKTFVGWTTTKDLSSSTEPTSNYWAKGTAVTISGDVTLYAVFATATTSGGGGTKEYTLTITKNDFNSTSYAANNNEKTSIATAEDGSTMEVKWTSYQVMLSSSTTQWQKGNGYIYNSTDLGTITDIAIDKTAGAYTTYIGSSEQPTSEGSGGYFKINVSNTETGKTNSVIVTFEKSSGGSSTTTYSDYVTTCESGEGEGGGDAQTGTTTFIVKSSTTLTSPWTDSDGSTWTYSGVSFGSTVNDAYFPENSFATVTLPSGCVATQIIVNRTSNPWSNKVSLDITSGATEIATITAPSSTATTITLETSKQFNTYTFAHDNRDDNKIWMDNIEIHYTSTSASLPARRVAKKATAVRAEKSEMVTRPVVKAPATLAAQECTSYENYTTICCAYPITDLKFAAGANSITLYWNTAAASATATLYSDEACETEVATQSDITEGTCTFTGLAKTTTYYAKVTTDDGCTAVLEVSTERPHVSVAEWAANQINIDVNTNEPITVVLENEVTGGSTSGNQATELFFSKYYEATANVKLVAVYNGTPDAIALDDYIIKYGKTAWATNYIPLDEFATTANGFALEGHLSPGEEMILYTKNVSDSRDVAIMDCVTEAYPDGKWIEVTTTNNTGSGSLSFGGDKVIALFEGNTLIDIIGAGNASAPTISGLSMTKPSWGDAKGWTCDEGLSIDDGTMIGISTNRCLLVRNNTVTSGENAVNLNTSDFVTLCTEWKGAHVPDDDIDDGVAASCENFAFVGTFDYSDYYVKYNTLVEDQKLPTEGRLEDGTYKVETPDLHDIACTNMRISLKDEDGNILVTQDLKVPIIIDGEVSTNDPIYFEYTQRENVSTEPELPEGQNENILTPEICADCDVVIRTGAQLTHEAGGVSQFNNMMVYPGAKFDNSSSKEFYLNSLQMQAKNDEVSYAIINNDGSSIDVGDMVFVKRIDDKYWYQFSLPYDCKVADIIQQNGQSMGKYWVDWGIKYYNGKLRQAEGTAASAGQVSQYWEKVEETATLKAHQGYIIGLFTTEWTNQMKFVYFTPATTNPYREAGDDEKTTNVYSWYIAEKPETDAQRHHGWNFTGSPYITQFGQANDGQGMNNTILMTGQMVGDDINGDYQGTDVYVTSPDLPAGLTYTQSLASGVTILPFSAYFVQTVDVTGTTDQTSTLTYAKGGRSLPSSAPARAAASKQRVLVELNITAPDGQIDNTGVWVDECYTTDYEIAADLTKMYVKGTKPQLYTMAADNDKMAYNALPDEAASYIPLGLYAPMAGNYTLALNNRVSRIAGAESIELLYNNAVVANLMIQDYTIAAEKGNVDGYSLCIRRRADVNTAIDNITGNTITVIANDGYISLVGIPSDASVYIYDMVGHLMDMQSANGTTVVNMPIMPQGVYNIVVANEHGSTTIKSFIK